MIFNKYPYVKRFFKDHWHLNKLETLSLISFAIVIAIFESLGMFMIWPAIGLFVDHQGAEFSIYGRILNTIGMNPNLAVEFLSVCILLIYLSKNLFIYFSEGRTLHLLESWKVILSNTISEHYFKSSYGFMRRTGSEDIASLLKTSIPYIVDEFCGNIIKISSQLFIVITILAIVIYFIGYYVILYIFLCLLLSMIISRVFRFFISQLDMKLVEGSALYQSVIDRAYASFREICSFGVSKRVKEDFHNANRKKSLIERQMNSLKVVPSLVNEVMFMGLLLYLMVTISLEFGNDKTDGYGDLYQRFGILVVSFLRLIPAINGININYQMLKSALDPLKNVINFIDGVNASVSEKSFGRKIDPTLNNDVLISVRDMHYNLPDGRVVDNLNFDVRKGQLIVISGPSGAGKSTLINILMGFLRPDGGTLSYNPKFFSEACTVCNSFSPSFQDDLIFDHGFYENIRFMRDDINRDDIFRLSERLGMDFLLEHDRVDDKIDCTNLSGGEKQRLSLIRALVGAGNLIVLDEPTSSLDGYTKNNVIELLSEIVKEEKKVIIIVSHDEKLIEVAHVNIRLQWEGDVCVRVN